jgi:hypothetical protein
VSGRSQLRCNGSVECDPAPQHRPCDARQLVGQGNHSDILVYALHQRAQSLTQRRGTARQGWQCRSRSVDEQLAEVFVAALGDAEQTRLAACGDLPWY